MHKIFKQIPLFALAISLNTGCHSANETQDAIATSPQEQFFQNLSTLCDKIYSGSVISTDPQDEEWRKEVLIITPGNCTETSLSIPLAVGEDTSRIWVITKTDTGLRLKHDHRHKDGTPDAVTQYGGDTQDRGTPTRQSFPVDDYSVALFEKEGLSASVTNVWSVEITPGERFAYELSREGRFFRAEFNLAASHRP